MKKIFLLSFVSMIILPSQSFAGKSQENKACDSEKDKQPSSSPSKLLHTSVKKRTMEEISDKERQQNESPELKRPRGLLKHMRGQTFNITMEENRKTPSKIKKIFGIEEGIEYFKPEETNL